MLHRESQRLARKPHEDHRTDVIPFPTNSSPDDPPAAQQIPFRRRAFYPRHDSHPMGLLRESLQLLQSGHVRASVALTRAAMETDLVDVCDRLGCKSRRHYATPRKRVGILKERGHISAQESRLLRKALRLANDAVHNQAVDAPIANDVFYAALLLRLFTVWVEKRGDLPQRDSLSARPGFDVEFPSQSNPEAYDDAQAQ